MSPSVGRLPPAYEHAASSEAWLRRTLEEILSQIRVLLDVDGAPFRRSVLGEALALYEAEGYEVVRHFGRPGHPVEIWLEKGLYS